MRTISVFSIALFAIHLFISDTDEGKSMAFLAILTHVVAFMFAQHFICTKNKSDDNP